MGKSDVSSAQIINCRINTLCQHLPNVSSEQTAFFSKFNFWGKMFKYHLMFAHNSLACVFSLKDFSIAFIYRVCVNILRVMVWYRGVKLKWKSWVVFWERRGVWGSFFQMFYDVSDFPLQLTLKRWRFYSTSMCQIPLRSSNSPDFYDSKNQCSFRYQSPPFHPLDFPTPRPLRTLL